MPRETDPPAQTTLARRQTFAWQNRKITSGNDLSYPSLLTLYVYAAVKSNEIQCSPDRPGSLVIEKCAAQLKSFALSSGRAGTAQCQPPLCNPPRSQWKRTLPWIGGSSVSQANKPAESRETRSQIGSPRLA